MAAGPSCSTTSRRRITEEEEGERRIERQQPRPGIDGVIPSHALQEHAVGRSTRITLEDPMHRRTTRRAVALTAAAVGICLAAVPAVAQDEPIKLAYLTKHLDNPWFISETGGAQELADELGVELTIQDLQFDANLALTAMDTVISAGTDGIIMVVPEQQIGPAVMEKAAAANVPLVTVDDP